MDELPREALVAIIKAQAEAFDLHTKLRPARILPGRWIHEYDPDTGWYQITKVET